MWINSPIWIDFRPANPLVYPPRAFPGLSKAHHWPRVFTEDHVNEWVYDPVYRARNSHLEGVGARGHGEERFALLNTDWLRPEGEGELPPIALARLGQLLMSKLIAARFS